MPSSSVLVIETLRPQGIVFIQGNSFKNLNDLLDMQPKILVSCEEKKINSYLFMRYFSVAYFFLFLWQKVSSQDILELQHPCRPLQQEAHGV